MTAALNIFFQIYTQFMNTVFNSLLIEENVSIGWVFLCIVIMSILIKNVLAVPHKGQTISRYRDYDDNTDRKYYWS